ncbi:MAG: ribonuclease R [Saprospiraceae bacterium]
MKTKIKKNANQKFHFDALKSLVADYLKRNSTKSYTGRQLLKAVHANNDLDEMESALRRLIQTQRVFEKNGQFQYGKNSVARIESADTPRAGVEGRLEIIRSGAAYLISDQSAIDVYIPEKFLNGAIHGDIVKITINPSTKRKPEGKVVEIVRRETNFFVGTFYKRKTIAVVYPDSANHKFEIHISASDSLEAKDGDKVIVHILSWRDGTHKYPKGKVTQIMDKTSLIDNEMMAILVNHGFPIDFSEEAKNIAQQVAGDMKDGLSWPDRKDFRDTTTFTIDPETARDFDDALSYTTLPDGNIEIGVHIADAAHYLHEGTILDQEAYARATSVYLVDRASPMLPEVLSGDVCSLKPNCDRLTFSVLFEFDQKFHVQKTWIGKSVIHSDYRFTYEKAQATLDEGSGAYYTELNQLNVISKELRKRRFDHGSIGFESPEYKFALDPVTGKPISLHEKIRIDTHMLIEEFMLLANKAVAEFIHRKEKNEDIIPFIYRVHDLPDMDKLADLAAYSKELGFPLKLSTPKEVSKSLNALYEETFKNDSLKVLQPLAIRTMAKAEYTTNNIGHYGLAFELYSHFTSPIRRYSDILAHRILFKNLHNIFRADKKKLEDQCKHISNQERKAMESERESVKFFQLLYIADHIGSEFDGFISGMIEKGLFIELEDNHVEGFIPFSEMSEPFILSDNRLKALGRSTGLVLGMGERIRIKVESIDMTLKRVQMSYLNKL